MHRLDAAHLDLIDLNVTTYSKRAPFYNAIATVGMGTLSGREESLPLIE